MDGWVPISRRPFSQVLVLRCRLEADGLEVFLCDETMKVLDPFITGANPLAAELLVREGQAGDARACLRDCLDEEREDIDPRVSARSRRRWLALLLVVVVLPMALGITANLLL